MTKKDHTFCVGLIMYVLDISFIIVGVPIWVPAKIIRAVRTKMSPAKKTGMVRSLSVKGNQND